MKFNLGGGGIGQGLLAGETINLTWYQQMPDNFEGDFYLLIEIINQRVNEIFSMDSSPLITLSSNNLGTTTLMVLLLPMELLPRDSVNKSGRYVVYERVWNRTDRYTTNLLLDMLIPEATSFD